MAKGWGNKSKGRSGNKAHRDAAEESRAAAELRELQRQRQQQQEAREGITKKTHKPSRMGSGGRQEKIDTEELTPKSKRRIEQGRKRDADYRRKKQRLELGAEPISDAVAADPTEAWRAKGNAHPDRARQRAAAELAAALPKNPAMHGPALAALAQHPVGKHAVDAAKMVRPQQQAAATAVVADIGTGILCMRAQAAARKAAKPPKEPKRAASAAPPSSAPGRRPRRSGSAPPPTAPTEAPQHTSSGGNISVDQRDAVATLFTFAAGDATREQATRNEAASLMGVPRQTAYRWFNAGEERRAEAMEGVAEWAGAPPRLGTRTISEEDIERAAAFIRSHPSVSWSPLTNDTVLVANEHGERVPTRVAHATDGLTPIFSDWHEANPHCMCERRFRDCTPKNIKPMSKRKRQFCACKYHMSMRMRHTRIKQLRAQILKEQREQQRAGGCGGQQRRGRSHSRGRGRGAAADERPASEPPPRPMDAPLQHDTLQDALDCITCDPPEGFQFVRAGCAHGQCSECPDLERRACEWDASREMSFVSLGKRQVGEDENGKPIMREMEVQRREKQSVAMQEYEDGLKFLKGHQFDKRMTHACITSRQARIIEGAAGVSISRDYNEKYGDKPLEERMAMHWTSRSTTLEVAVIRGCKDGTPVKHFVYHISDHPEQSYDVTKYNTVSDIKLCEELGLLDEGQTVYEATDKCAGQYISTPALFAMSQTACLTGHAIDRACPASGHGRSDNDAAGGGAKHFLENEQKKGDAGLVDSAAESFAATCGAALEQGFENKAVAHMNSKRSSASIHEKNHVHVYTEAELDEFFKKLPRCPTFKTAKLEGGGFTKDHCYHYLADPRDGLGFIRYRRWACACDVCWASPQNNYDTTGCKYAEIFGDMNPWHLIDLRPLMGKQRADVQQRADLALQEETDSFVDTIKASVTAGEPTHAMVSKGVDGDDDFWLTDPVDGIVRTLDDDCVSPMLTDADGAPLQHSKGDRVIDCYFWYPYGAKHLRRYYLDVETVIPIPTHMFLSLAGFVMPTAPAPKRGKHQEWIKRLPDDVYDAIQERMPEAWTDAFM